MSHSLVPLDSGILSDLSGSLLASPRTRQRKQAEDEAALEEEVARLRCELESEAKRRTKHPKLLQACDEAICKAATDLAIEQGCSQETDGILSSLVADAVGFALDLKPFLGDCEVVDQRLSILQSQIAWELALRELPRSVERWVLLVSRALETNDFKNALDEEASLLEEAKADRHSQCGDLLREMENLEVTNTQLRSFEQKKILFGSNDSSLGDVCDTPTSSFNNSTPTPSSASTSTRPAWVKEGGHLHRFGRWLKCRVTFDSEVVTSKSFNNLSNAAPGTLLLDDLLSLCWEAREWQVGVHIKFPESALRSLLKQVRTVFLAESALLEVDAPMNVCGDIHGQYHDLLRLFEAGGEPPKSNYMFLGDYVDRGQQSIETIILLFAYKVKYRENFFLLRGNHECASITRMYGFYDECKRRYNVSLWKEFCNVFNCMPVCGLIDDKIMCMHGGLSPVLDDFEEVRRIRRPMDVPHRGIMCDLLWADPDGDVHGWQPSDRGVSYLFGPNVVHDFVDKHGLDLICRAHQVMEEGYEFFADRRLVTVFSAPNYCGEFDNLGAFMFVDSELRCGFQIIRPEYG